MSRIFNGNAANYLVRTGSLFSGWPITIATWVKMSDWSPAASMGPFIYNINGTYELRMRWVSANSAWYYGAYTNGTSATTATTPTDGTWALLIGIVVSTDQRLVIPSQSVDVTNTTDPPAYSESSPFLRIGQATNGGYALDGRVATWTAWNALLSAGEISSLAGGALPSTVATGSLVANWDFRTNNSNGDLTDTVASYVLTVNGTVTYDDGDNPSLSGGAPAPLSITSVTPSSFDDGHTGIVIAGTGFGATQGSSTLKIGSQAQTVTAWSDTSITFTCVRDSGGSMGARQLVLTKG